MKFCGRVSLVKIIIKNSNKPNKTGVGQRLEQLRLLKLFCKGEAKVDLREKLG